MVYNIASGTENRALDLQENQPYPHNQLPLNNVNMFRPKPKQQRPPDIIDNNSDPIMSRPPNPYATSPTMPVPHNNGHNYDLENASSIAPSDIDIYHYKGYRNRKSNSKKPKKLHATPLARLSPSSEMSHKILTLNDLSGKQIPSGLLSEQRSLHSPVSHVSSASQNNKGLTSENVARFNQRSTPTGKSSLLNTLDLSKTHTSASSSTSSSAGSNDDSFTCSEFEYDEANPGDKHVKDLSDVSANNGMIFNKLVSPERSRSVIRSSSDEEDHMPIMPPGKTWESLLGWMPDYQSFSGVCRDIAELPPQDHNLEFSRPSPIGNRTEEQYI